MKKILSLFFVALFSVGLWGNTYWYTGDGHSWDGGTAMLESTNKVYDYIKIGQRSANTYYEIREVEGRPSAYYGYGYNKAGFAGTDIINMNNSSSTWSTNNGALYYVDGDFYIIVWKPNTTINTSNNPIICASTTLPSDEIQYFITGDSALVVDLGLDKSKAWTASAIQSTSEAYVLENLKANQEYKLKVIIDGVDWDTQKSFYNLNPHTAGIYTDNSGAVCFRLAEAGDVTVTYNNTTYSVTGNFSMPEITIDANWGEGWDHPQALINRGDGTADIEITLAASTTYEFGFWIGGFWTTNNYTYKYDYTGSRVVKENNGNMKLNTDKAGAYKFTWTYAGNLMNITFPSEATALDNTNASNKAVKRIVNGQLVIEREGKLFNALGAEVK